MIPQPTQGASRSRRFRPADRLRKSRDYARSRSQGKRVASRFFSLEATSSLRSSRLGLVVSRRAGGAVTRNRLKRVVREWFRVNRTQLPARTDLVVVARSRARELATREAWRELFELVSKLAR